MPYPPLPPIRIAPSPPPSAIPAIGVPDITPPTKPPTLQIPSVGGSGANALSQLGLGAYQPNQYTGLTAGQGLAQSLLPYFLNRAGRPTGPPPSSGVPVNNADVAGGVAAGVKASQVKPGGSPHLKAPNTPATSPETRQSDSASGAAGSSDHAGSIAAGLRAKNLITNQFGYQADQELSPTEAAAACGPNAALSFARYSGRNPTISEALSLAKQVGWTPSLGMAGPDSEVKLLGSLGVSSQYQAGASPQDVQGQLQAGKPVIIDTPNHYYVVDDYDPATGQYHDGGSGLALRGGSDWLSWEQIDQFGGGYRGVISLGEGPAPASTQPMARTPNPAADVAHGDLGGALSGLGQVIGGALGQIKQSLSGAAESPPPVVTSALAAATNPAPAQASPAVDPTQGQTLQENPKRLTAAEVSPTSSLQLQGAPSLSTEQIHAYLVAQDSPMAPYAQTIYDAATQNGIDPVYLLAIWQNEHHLMKAPGIATDGNNPGDISYTGGAYGEIGSVEGTHGISFAKFKDVPSGIQANARLFAREYFPKGLTTPRALTNVYSSNAAGDPTDWGDEVAQTAQQILAQAGGN